ncbi:MAG TPA: phosphate ABC transporter permease subunit PstC [Methanoregulaceae archaeon]|nr:phosphate ABC transporter permease subunit PstC [Methanoregulaceae archaeon]HPD75980.1 phosphate ABC transporter permease subunit PstC [Methanoregulaceae archaeon]
MMLQATDQKGQGSAGVRRDRFDLSAARSRELREKAVKTIWFATALSAIVAIVFILLFLIRDSLPIFIDVGFVPFLTGTTWYPTGVPPQYGVAVLILGTVLVTLGAMLFAVPLSIGCAIFIAELAPLRVRNVLKPAVELLAGIPSIVYGFFGLIVLTDFIRVVFDVPTGETWLAGSILLSIMALPTIISISEDAISMVPREYKEGSLAIGATRWQTISRVLIPGALSGITAAIILGFGRAIGETMAVMMVTGNAAIIPDPIWNVLSPVRTLTGTLGIEMGEVAVGSEHYAALFGVAVVLLIITLIVNSAAVVILTNIRERQMGGRKKGFSVLDATRAKVTPEIVDGLTLFLVVGALLIVMFNGVLVLQQMILNGIPAISGIPSDQNLPVVLAMIAACPLALIVLAMAAIMYLLRNRLSPKTTERIAFSLVIAAAVIVILILVIILQDIIVHGLPAISWEFLTGSPRDLGRAGGIFPAIVGTCYLVAGAILFALPLGIGAAIYLVEYTKESRITKLIRTTVDLLNGTPSIVFGLFGLAFLVYFLNFGVSLLAGQITLGLMVLPTIIRATEETLRTIPQSLREGSLAMGATRWQTIWRVVLPPAIPGILTGTILSIGRAAGETAPIMFTAVVFSQRYLPSSVFEPVMALPYHLYILATNVPGSSTNKYGTALVLLILVIGIYSVAIGVRHHFSKKLRG